MWVGERLVESSDDMLVSFFSVCIKSCHLFRDLYVVVRLQKTNSRKNFFFCGHGLPTADKNGIYKKNSERTPLHDPLYTYVYIHFV